MEDCSGDGTLAVARDLAGVDARISVIALPGKMAARPGRSTAASRPHGASGSPRWTPTTATRPADCTPCWTRASGRASTWWPTTRTTSTRAPTCWCGLPSRTATGGRLIGLADFIAHSDTSAEFSFGILKPVIRAAFIRRHAAGLPARPEAGTGFLPPDAVLRRGGARVPGRRHRYTTGRCRSARCRAPWTNDRGRRVALRLPQHAGGEPVLPGADGSGRARPSWLHCCGGGNANTGSWCTTSTHRRCSRSLAAGLRPRGSSPATRARGPCWPGA